MLRDIALFVAVGRTRSIKKAAAALGMPDSTLSRRISAMEKALGIRLLHRSTRRIELTEAGLAYYAECTEVIAAAERAQQHVKEFVETPQGKLRMSLPVDFSTLFLAPMIAEFAAIYPKIQFDLQLSERWVDLVSEGVDLSIRLGPQPDSTLTARKIAEIRYGLYAAGEYLARAGVPAHPAALAEHACIRMVCPHWDDAWTLLGDGETVQVNVAERIAANNLALVRRFAVLGAGIAPLDEVLAQEDVEAGRLVRVLEAWSFRPVPVFALTPTKLLPAKTRIFIDFLVERMRKPS